jgi:hypothetical protein
LKHRIDELAKHPAEQVIKTPALLLELLRLYSEIFLNSKPCSTCEKMHGTYYTRLIREGKKQIEKNRTMTKATCKLKDNACVFFKGAHYTNANITDAVAVQMIKAFPALKQQFVTLPSKPAPKKEQPKTEKTAAAKPAEKKTEPKK